MTTMTEPDVLTYAGVRTDRFYVRIASVMVAVAVIGFAPTYWVPLGRGTLAVTPLVHVHALLFFGWMLLFWTQTWLAASGRLGRHRELGVAGVILACAMCVVGFATATGPLERAELAGSGPAGRAFSVVSFTALLFFAVLVAVAVLNVRTSATHKRLMLVATASLLQAGVGRWFALFLRPPDAVGPPPVIATVVAGLATDLLVVAAMIHDRRTRGRVHPAYWVACAALVALQVLRVPLSTTPLWTRFTESIVPVSGAATRAAPADR
jgi:hypothetical protein